MIAGYFDPLSPQWPVPMVRVALYLPRINSQWVFVDFLLDTGASTTSLHPRDALTQVGISAGTLAQPDMWPQRTSHQGIGGSPVYYQEPVTYGLEHTDGTWQTIPGELAIAQLRPDNLPLPSLLGWDVLQRFRVNLNWADRTVTLDSPPSSSSTP